MCNLLNVTTLTHTVFTTCRTSHHHLFLALINTQTQTHTQTKATSPQSKHTLSWEHVLQMDCMHGYACACAFGGVCQHGFQLLRKALSGETHVSIAEYVCCLQCPAGRVLESDRFFHFVETWCFISLVTDIFILQHYHPPTVEHLLLLLLSSATSFMLNVWRGVQSWMKPRDRSYKTY